MSAQYLIEIIKGQQIYELERIAGVHSRTTGAGAPTDDGSGGAVAPPTLHLDFFRCQVFKNTVRAVR